MHRINAVDAVLSLIQGELNGNSKNKLMSPGMSNCDIIIKYLNYINLIKEKLESNVTEVLNVIDSENTGQVILGKLQRGTCACEHVCVCVSPYIHMM